MLSIRKLLLSALMLCALCLVQEASAQTLDDTCDPIDSVFVIDTNGVLEVYWMHNDTTILYNVRIREIGIEDTTFMIMSTLGTAFLPDVEDGCASYEIGIRPVCPFDTTQYTVDTFEVFCTSSVINRDRPEIVQLAGPNPFHEMIYWNERPPMGSRWQLFDSSGRPVKNGTVLPSATAINTQELDRGLYFLVVADGTERQVQKLIKQ